MNRMAADRRYRWTRRRRSQFIWDAVCWTLFTAGIAGILLALCAAVWVIS